MAGVRGVAWSLTKPSSPRDGVEPPVSRHGSVPAGAPARDGRLRRHRGYGLLFESEIELPWPVTARDREPDVSVRIGAVPSAVGSAADGLGCWQAAPGSLLLDVDGIAHCRVLEGGRRVLFAPERGVRDAAVCLLDSILAACLQMRGVLVLHASAVATAEGAALFAGPVGIGKSTLVAALADRGYPLLADGAVGIAPTGGGPPRALPGFPQIRLWRDAMDDLDESWRRAAGTPVRPGIESYAVAAPRFSDGALPVRAVHFLARADTDEVAFEPVTPARAVTCLLRNTLRARFLRGLGQGGTHFRAMAEVARHAAAGHLRQPRHACPPAKVAAEVVTRLPAPA